MRFTTYAAASALAALAKAQTFTDCNPMEKACPNNPAMPETFETDFTTGKDAFKGWKQTAGALTYNNEGAVFTVAKKGDAPTIGSESFLHFGYVEVKMKAAPGQGIISSIVLQSDDLDEVDWEWIGGVDSKVQMNYFGKGNTTTYDRMIEADVGSTQNEFHTYALNWTAESLTWLIDDKPMRTLNYGDANGGKNFPQTPCNVRLGNWPGGDSKDKGTVEWAGGKVDYTKGPFDMTVASIKVINYSPGTEYHWKDKSGSFGSIEVIGAGNKDGAPQNTAVLDATASATGTGAPLESGFAAPSATGFSNGTSTCTEEKGATPAPSTPSKTNGSGGNSDFNYPVSTPAGSANTGGSGYGTGNSTSGDAPCDCGTAVVTVTGTPPATATAVPSTPASSPVLGGVGSTPVSTPLGTTATPPSTLSTAVSSYVASSGLLIETAPAPEVPAPSPAPVPAPVPSVVAPPAGGNATTPTTSAPAQFTGAASSHRAGAWIAGAVAGVWLFAL
ncbi:concanavalin A-like lectin/glucanase domain-containing protein [Boeremia exigua]|uniref:concanavalin A-like lectin/glucanase domain-containing protein n=1 Tax=Boeremia exigua TaxID=749465 RepID=UPI001E8E8DF4|nr:concanavalin A-like lectin/glucanase domain-containing protein [Boeremia exigua]KAH6643548.1 concanavalin A-like lectin/glucanase domain-containing protein [Boeremia exigua]